MGNKIYVFYNVSAEAKNGKVKIIIDEPFELMEIANYKKIANNQALKRQVSQLKELITQKKEGTIKLATKEKPIRIGGGFAQLEDPTRKFLLVRRGPDAPRMPLALDIPAGLFDEIWEEPIQMMCGEAVEIARVKDNTLYYPSLRPDKKVRQEAEDVASALQAEGISIERIEELPSTLQPLSTPVEEITYMNHTYKGLGIAFEYESASLELIGLLKVQTRGKRFSYAFGEVVNGRLLKNEILAVDISTHETEVWRFLKLERTNPFNRELELSRGFTSKAALASRAIGLVTHASTDGKWEILL
jgi:hypothetical protein